MTSDYQHLSNQGRFRAENRKISEFAKIVGIDASLLRNYINGFKKPSPAREQTILAGIHTLAREYAAAMF